MYNRGKNLDTSVLFPNTIGKRLFHRWDPPGSMDFDMKVPDWRQYKIKGIKELEIVERELAQKGLKNPWLRNEVWRYPVWLEAPGRQLRKMFWVPLKPACFITFGIIIAEELYWKKFGRPPYVHTWWDFFIFPHH